jgi:uncharacterized protein (DUF488 family)
MTVNSIDIVIDVRSTPMSRYFASFNKSNLLNALPAVGITYENWTTEFGARQNDPELYTNGILDYDKFAKTPQFKSGIEKVIALNNEGKTICLLCAEIDPIGCHRAILCGRHLAEKGLSIQHIISRRNGDTRIEMHPELEARMMQFGETKEEAYKRINKKIGYKKD